MNQGDRLRTRLGQRLGAAALVLCTLAAPGNSNWNPYTLGGSMLYQDGQAAWAAPHRALPTRSGEVITTFITVPSGSSATDMKVT